MAGTDVERDGRRTAWRNPVLRFEGSCRAPATVVYDLLADLPSHLEWGGQRQGETTRLLTLQAPQGPASVGVEFADHRVRRQGGQMVGSIGGHGGHPPRGLRVRHRRAAGRQARAVVRGCSPRHTVT